MSNPNLVVVDELNGADSRGGPGRFTIRNAVVHEAAVGERLGWEECGTCKGHGMVKYVDAPTKLERAILHPCPDCFEGWTPPAELVLKAEEVYFEAEQGTADKWRNAMFYALLEQARWIERNE